MRKGSWPMWMDMALLVVAVFIGSIFIFGMQYWNKQVTQEECQKIETQFVGYKIIRQAKKPGTIKEIAIDCANGKRYFIDGVSINSALREKLDALVYEESITLFIHPNSNTILEFSSNDEMILQFSETMDKLCDEVTGFLFLGLFIYLGALWGVYDLVRRVIGKRENK